MHLLLDENLSVVTAHLLREAGHDVIAVADEAPGASDPDVIALARAADRVLVTFDRDIGARIFHHGDPPPPGVVYLRFVPTGPAEAARVLLAVLGDDTLGQFVTLRRDRLRAQPLPYERAR